MAVGCKIRSSVREGQATLGTLLIGKKRGCERYRRYAIVCEHVTKAMTPGSNVYRKTKAGRCFEIGTILHQESNRQHRAYRDYIDMIQIYVLYQNTCKSGYVRKNGQRCAASVYKGDLDGLKDKEVYYLCLRSDSRKIIEGKVIDVQTAGEDHFLVASSGDTPFACQGKSGAIVAMEIGGQVELIGIITSGDCDFHVREKKPRRGSVRCLLLHKAIAFLESEYHMELELLPYDPRQSNGLECGMDIYFQCRPFHREEPKNVFHLDRNAAFVMIMAVWFLCLMGCILYLHIFHMLIQ